MTEAFAGDTSASTTTSAVWRRRAGLPVVEWPAFDGLGLDAFVTSRRGGVSSGGYASLNLGLHVGDDAVAVVENRERVARAAGAGLDRFVFCEQVHQPGVHVVTAGDAGRGARGRADAVAATDALVTVTPGVVLVVMVADCVPLVLFDPVRRVLAVVHAGWAGTVRGVTPAAVEAMRGFGSDPADVVAGVGPSVHPERYQVGADVRGLAVAAFGPRAPEVVHPATTAHDGTEPRWTFDLWRAAAVQLAAAGLRPEVIHVAGMGTGPSTPFFSHRFEGPTAGRFAAVARLHPV